MQSIYHSNLNRPDYKDHVPLSWTVRDRWANFATQFPILRIDPGGGLLFSGLHLSTQREGSFLPCDGVSIIVEELGARCYLFRHPAIIWPARGCLGAGCLPKWLKNRCYFSLSGFVDSFRKCQMFKAYFCCQNSSAQGKFSIRQKKKQHKLV